MPLQGWGDDQDSEATERLQSAYDAMKSKALTSESLSPEVDELRRAVPAVLRELRNASRQLVHERKAWAFDGPPDAAPADDLAALCEQEIGGALALICHKAFRSGWPPETVYAAIHAWTENMAEFDRKAMGKNPMGVQ